MLLLFYVVRRGLMGNHNDFVIGYSSSSCKRTAKRREIALAFAAR